MTDWDRFNDQFRETEDERNERQAEARRRRIAVAPCGWEASNARDGECEKCGGLWHDLQRPRECMEPQR